MTLLPGSHLGPYEIRGSLGAGGMGEVYRAHDPRLGREVALKILPESMAKDPEGLARFTREARAVAALNHPHIVTIYSTEEEDGVRFMTMELIEGRTLDRMIPEGGVSLAQFFDVSMALADALSAAHQKQITHRDLKPANVMVTDAGRVKVLDFGLARGGEGTDQGPTSIEEQATRQKLTQAGTILGTMPYMSPEQIEAKALDGRSDIFSLGIVMYEMATGGRPFRGQTSPALMSSIMREHPKAATELRRDLPVGASQLIGKCLEKNPRDRVQAAHGVLVELKALRRAWESGASEPGAPRRGAVNSGRRAARSRSSSLAIAVSPLVAPAHDPELESLAQGLTEDIATGLSRFPDLTVLTSRDSEARYSIEGSLRRSGGTMRMSVRLIDSDSGARMWAENYDRPLREGGLFELQDDLTGHAVATVADAGGVLVRSMAAALLDRPVEDLCVDELVLRHLVYTHNFRPEEHQRLRSGLEKALAADGGHALGWACLSSLYEQEHSQHLNPLPDSRARAAAAAARSVEIDPTCQAGWRAIAAQHYFNRDLHGLRMAAERAIPLNPLSSATIAYLGMALAQAGDWDRGIPIVRRAVDLNPQHPGWFHYPLFADHYRKGEYELALTHAKRANMPQFVWSPLSVAVAAGQLGRATDARMALDGLRKDHPAYLGTESVRSLWSLWLWEADLVERLMDGYHKAHALTAPEPAISIAEESARASSVVMAPTSGRSTSIAVLSFTDLSAAKDQDWFCDGIAEEILNALSQLKGLRVAARGSAFSFKGKGEDLNSIGEKLNVGTILEGSVRRSGDRVRITAQLSDVKDGFQLWSERYDREMKDIFDVQDEIAKAIAERLKVTLVGAGDGRLVRRATDNIEAYETYLQGRALLYKRGRYILEARRQFQRVVDMDPGYALAFAGLADADSIEGIQGMVRPEEARSRAIEAARRAVTLDAAASDAHSALGSALLLYLGDRDGAERAYLEALALNPNNVQARCWYAVFVLQSARGRLDEGVAEARRAVEADPLSAYARAMFGISFALAGRTDEALPLLRAARESDSSAFVGQWGGGAALLWAGRPEEAVSLLEMGVQLGGHTGYAAADLVTTLARCGRLAEALGVLERMKQEAATAYASPLSLACASVAVGDLAGAMTLAHQGLAERDPLFLLQGRHWPSFQWLREQPEWPAMLKQLDSLPKAEP